MLYIIYSIYVDSLLFLRKNILVVGIFLSNSILSMGITNLLKDYAILRSAVETCLLLLIPALINVYTTVLVYKANELIDSSETLWQIVKRFYERAFLLNLVSSFVSFAIVFLPFIVLSLVVESYRRIWNILFAITFLFFYLGLSILGTKWMILHDGKIISSIQGGFKELRTGFTFYILVVLIGVVFSSYFSLIVPSNWLVFLSFQL